MNHVFYRSHTGFTMKGSMLSCCTAIPWCTMQGGFHLAGFCRVHWPWANRFCTMKSFQSLLSAYDVSASDPVVLWDYHGSLHRKAKLCGSSCSLENCVVEASRSTKNCPIKKSWLQYSDTSCPSMVFNDSLWNLIGFKLICPWQKLPQDHAWKVV